MRVKSEQSWLNGSLLRKLISPVARGSPTALSSACATAAEFGLQAANTNEGCVPSSTTAVGRITIWVFTVVANSFWIPLKFPLTPPVAVRNVALSPTSSWKPVQGESRRGPPTPPRPPVSPTPHLPPLVPPP